MRVKQLLVSFEIGQKNLSTFLKTSTFFNIRKHYFLYLREEVLAGLFGSVPGKGRKVGIDSLDDADALSGRSS